MAQSRTLPALIGVTTLTTAALAGLGLGRYAIGEVDAIYSGFRPLTSTAIAREEAAFARDFWERQERRDSALPIPDAPNR